MTNTLPEIINGPFYIEGESKPPLDNEIINGYHLDFAISNTFFSTVFVGWKDKQENKKAIKFIKRRPENIDMIENELTAISIIKHKTILELHDFFPYNEYVCIVTPYAIFGTLKKFISTEYPTGIDEDLARIIMKQIIEGLMNIHAANFIHRDIKPENILIINNNENEFQIVISDFGLAKQYCPNEKDKDSFGSYEYAAPEIYLKNPYDYSIDIWSLGITLFVMLSGRLPYRKQNCHNAIIKGHFNYEFLNHISNEGVQLVKEMCQHEPSKRISLNNALKSTWINKDQKDNRTEQETYNYINTSNEVNE